MINTLKVLEQIQKIDLDIRAIEEEDRQCSKVIDEIGAEIKSFTQSIEGLDAEAAALRAQLKELDEKIRESSERVSKDEKRLNSVKNDRELSAITKEINGANKTKKQGEQEKTALDTKLKDKDAAIGVKRDALAAREEEVKRLTEELASKRAGWKDLLEGKLRSKDEIKSGIALDIFKRYEMIRSKRAGLALVQVKDEICQGCFTHIPPQVYIMLKRGTEELQSCPHCHRLLYVENQGQLEAV